MFSQFKNVVEGLAQPRPSHSHSRSIPGRPSSPAKPSAERLMKAKLEDRLRASFTIGEVSNPSTPTASARVSPAPQFVTEHPLSHDHPLSPAAIPLPSSPPAHDDHGLLPAVAPLTLPGPLSSMSPDVSENLDAASDTVVDLEPDNQHPPQTSPPESPTISQVSEQKPTASEEGTGVNDATESIVPEGISCDQADIISNEPVTEIAQADRRQLGEVAIHTEKPQSEHSFSDGVEAPQAQLKLMEQQFTDISASFAKLQAEQMATDKVLQEMTPLQGCQDSDGLRNYLQNAQLKVEMLQDEVNRLTGKLTRQDERIEELRETHRLESGSQIELVDELRSQLQQNEALLKATRSSNSHLEADITKQKTEMDQLRTEVEKLTGLAKGEEEKCNKAINHLKAVRQRLVKAEKERDDALKEVATLKEGQKAEHDKLQLEREKLQSELNKLKVEKEVSLADLRAHFEKELMASKQRSEKDISALRGQFELEAAAAQSRQEHALGLKDAQIDRLEKSTQSLSTERDSLFDQLQIRQAEGESAQSLLEVLQSQNTELQYQVREKDDRIAQLNEELSDFRQEQHSRVSDPSTSPEEVAKLLATAESRHEAKLTAVKQRLASMEAERVEVEAEWRRKVEAKQQEAQRWKSMVDTASQDRQEDDEHTQELQREVERLRLATRTHEYDVSQLRRQIELLSSEEEIRRQQLSDQVQKISILDHQLEEITTKELQARTNNKTLREELRKVQSSAALLDRLRGPGVGYWSSASTLDANDSSAASSRPSSSSRPDSPIVKSKDEELNLEYLRNVIFQFLEHKEMRPDLVRVLSTILRFTPQETRRLIAKV